jgi:uncharacterized SAM-binding protein YcdF (DUF218 family)
VTLQKLVLRPPAVLYGAAQTRLTSMGQTHAQQIRRVGKAQAALVVPPAAIIVLGGGREALASEYGASDLSDRSMARLRYGVWLSRQTALPLGFSGGVGWAQKVGSDDLAEADVAARLVEQQFGARLQWIENASSDTRGNAALTVAMLAAQGVPEVVLVTDAFHMRRAQRAFEEAARKAVAEHPTWPLMRVTPAPIGVWHRADRAVLDWLPTAEGVVQVRVALREILGLLAGS